MIKAVFIDIDNTLLDFEACAVEAMQKGFAERGVEYKSEMLEIFKSVNDRLWKKIEQGTLTFDELLKIRWKTIFAELKIELDGPEFETYFRNCLRKSAVPMKGAFDALTYLSGKYRLFAASNGPFEQQKNRLEKAGMLKFFEDVFTSEKIGVEKPNRQFFEYCFKSIGDILPSESVMLGDSLTSDMKGGNDFEMQTIWLNLKGEKMPQWINYEINSLYEIKEIL